MKLYSEITNVLFGIPSVAVFSLQFAKLCQISQTILPVSFKNKQNNSNKKYGNEYRSNG